MAEISWPEFNCTTSQVLYYIYLLLHSKYLLCCYKEAGIQSDLKLSRILLKVLESEKYVGLP